MYKKIEKSIYLVIIFYILAISLTGCSDSNSNDNKVLKEKVSKEIEYLELKLIDMLNYTNGISLYNYIVKAEQISTTTSSKSEKEAEASQEQSQKTTSNQEKKDNQQNETSEENTENSNENNVLYKMEKNEILLQDRKTDWTSLKSYIEKIYSDWTIIQLDLYKLNINNQEVLNFSSDLDVATQAIKDEDKAKTLTCLAKLYEYIPIYSTEIEQNAIISNVYKTKSNLFNVYAIIEENNFIKVEEEMNKMEQAFLPVVNNINSDNQQQININKAYILIKELQNFSSNKDIEIFYIKYKNLIQELNNIR